MGMLYELDDVEEKAMFGEEIEAQKEAMKSCTASFDDFVRGLPDFLETQEEKRR